MDVVPPILREAQEAQEAQDPDSDHHIPKAQAFHKTDHPLRADVEDQEDQADRPLRDEDAVDHDHLLTEASPADHLEALPTNTATIAPGLITVDAAVPPPVATRIENQCQTWAAVPLPSMQATPRMTL